MQSKEWNLKDSLIDTQNLGFPVYKTLDFWHYILWNYGNLLVVITMIQREASKAVMRLAKQFPVIGITGPRQSGKTVLVKNLFPNKPYVTFDDARIRAIAKANPYDFLLAYPDGAVIDEAQKIPELFDAIKYSVDNRHMKEGSFILTGLSQFRLKDSIKESLAGRIGNIELLPFTINELKSNNCLKENAYQQAIQGFYPPLYDEHKHYLSDDWFENYIETYLERDISEEINHTNLHTFKKFIQICALFSGQMVNMESISRMIGISATTVKAWLSLLEASYIIHLLQPDTFNIGKSLVKTPKLYFLDVGLLCYLLRLNEQADLILSEKKGAVIETMAVGELIKNRTNQGRRSNLTYYRDVNGFEIDTIADWKKTFAIEVKSDSDSEKKLSKNIRKYIENRGNNTHGAVFYLGDLNVTINNIDYIGWKNWSDFAKVE
ncbi:MAG: ATP-binding protein [Solobacterium sp.]|nr:ATP-binding protein [Solobacterium sp.]